jgi:hypothetical protein
MLTDCQPMVATFAAPGWFHAAYDVLARRAASAPRGVPAVPAQPPRRMHATAVQTPDDGRPSAKEPGRTRSTSAARMRRLRERRKAGATLVKILITAPTVGQLVAMGWLRPNAPAAEVRQAFAQMIRRALGEGVRPR